MPLTAALFDLDGTLTDPFEGITRSIQYALEKMDVPVPPQDDLRWCIGPPLWDSFAILLKSDNRADQDRAVGFYRERFRETGLFENTVIEGIEAAVRDLKQAGVRLFVCTSKPHVYAVRIVEKFGLMGYFEKVYGSELDGTRSAKAELIAYLLEQEGLTADGAVMIGDREHDLIGANANDMRALGVLWGYGPREELEEHHPHAIAQTPADLGPIFKSLM